ncbi:MAG: polysaccharide biosynthesis C-terminal domain-containing protein [Acholeplasmatales bacterium]|nr:polysaccharide biosynthesis C-terminal domain-containing protein [Acholeplasmatales bacterium]
MYLYKTLIPFGTATLFFTIYQLIDTITLSKIEPHTYTTYMFEVTRLIFIPIILCQSIAGVITPRINYLYINNNIKEANQLAVKISNIALFILFPVIYIFIINSKDIYQMFYNEGDYTILSSSALLIFYIGFYKILIGLSQGMPKFEYIISSTIISAIAKLVLNIVFIPQIGYKGAIIATILAIAVNMLFAYILLNKGGIQIFVKNIKSLIIGIISVLLSGFISSLISVLIVNINKIIYLISSISIFILIYLFFILLISYLTFTKPKNLHTLN